MISDAEYQLIRRHLPADAASYFDGLKGSGHRPALIDGRKEPVGLPIARGERLVRAWHNAVSEAMRDGLPRRYRIGDLRLARTAPIQYRSQE